VMSEADPRTGTVLMRRGHDGWVTSKMARPVPLVAMYT
jgi:hypothetical protein